MDNLKYFKGLKTEKSITKKYRELAKKYHPDKAGEDKELQEKFHKIMQEINAEHQEVLILLKYKALDSSEEKAKEPKNVNNVNKKVKQVSSVFSFTDKQKEKMADKGRDFFVLLYDSVIENFGKIQRINRFF